MGLETVTEILLGQKRAEMSTSALAYSVELRSNAGFLAQLDNREAISLQVSHDLSTNYYSLRRTSR